MREIAEVLELGKSSVGRADQRNKALAQTGVLWGVRQSTSRQITPEQRKEGIDHWHDNTRKSADVSVCFYCHSLLHVVESSHQVCLQVKNIVRKRIGHKQYVPHSVHWMECRNCDMYDQYLTAHLNDELKEPKVSYATYKRLRPFYVRKVMLQLPIGLFIVDCR